MALTASSLEAMAVLRSRAESVSSPPRKRWSTWSRSIGSGVLGLPYAFREGGLVTSLVVVVLVAVIVTHCMLMLVNAKRKAEEEDPTVVSFSDIAYFTYGRAGAILVDVLLVFTQYGFCCVYVVFISQNTANFLPDSGWYVSWRMVVIWWIPVLVILANLPTLKHMSYASMFANLTIILSILAIMGAAVGKLDEKDPSEVSDDIEVWIVPSTIAVMFGMTIYSFEGIGMVIPAETAMKRPEHFKTVLVTTTAIASFIYITFGLICYVAWGTDTDQIVTVNLNDYADGETVWEVLSIIVMVGLIIAIASTYPLQMFVVTDILEEAMFKPGRLSTKHRWIKVFFFRCLLVLGTVGVAVSIPDFGLLMGFIGAVGCTALQFIFPSLFQLKLFPDAPLYCKAVPVIYILFGLAGSIAGTVQTVLELVDKHF